MSGIDSLIEKLASTTVEVNVNEKEVSFAGQALKLDSEEDAAEIVKAINECPGMTTLRLEGNTIGIPAAKVIAKAIESQPNFKNALWRDVFTRRDKDEIPQALSFLSSGIMLAKARLVELDLSDNAFGPRGLIGIVKLLESSSCYTLKELHLNNNGLGIQGATMLANAMCNCIENSRKDGSPLALKVFVCGRNRLENEGATAVSRFLKKLGTLESVAMPQNGIYHPGIKHLAEAFSANCNLKVINLEDNSLTEEGAKYIADCLPSLKKIQMLNFGDCLIRTKGALAMASALKVSCPDLRELYLGYNEINKDGGKAIVEAMEDKEMLEMVVLNGNQFGDDGCQLIQDRMAEFRKYEKLGTLSEDEGEEEDDDDDDDDDDNEENVEEELEEEECDSQDEVPNALNILSGSQNSVHPSPLFTVTPKDFISQPTSSALIALLNTKEDFSSILPSEPSVCDYLNLFLKICLVVKPGDEKAKAAACKYADDYLSKAFSLCSDDILQFNNAFLVCLGLLKGEDTKAMKNLDVSGAFLVLEHAVKQPYFHPTTRDLLQFFLSRPLLYVTACGKIKHILMQTLYQV